MKKLISILLALALLVSCIAALAEAEPEEYACREENFSTRIPAGTSAAYEEGTGLMIYARSEGNIPYVIVSRRPLDMKFQNPENYLNNVFREVFDDDTIVVKDETTADDIEDWDSFEHINLVVAIEDEFGFKIPMGKTVTMKNVGEMVDIIMEMGK